MEKLLSEVWFIILSYIPHNDLIEASAACKLFFGLSRKNYFFVEKLSHSRLLFNNSLVNFDCYENVFLSLYGQLCFSHDKYIKEEDYFLQAKEIIMKKIVVVYVTAACLESCASLRKISVLCRHVCVLYKIVCFQ